MAAKISRYDDTWLNQIAYKKSLDEGGETNSAFFAKARELVRRAIDEELTEKQKNILMLYYFENFNMPQIAEMYSLNKSTVCRHIKTAKKRIKHVMKYVMLLRNH